MPDTSKTEKATPKRRKDERKKGNVFQSRDAVSAAGILLTFLTLKAFFPYLYQTLSRRLILYIGMTRDFQEVSLSAFTSLGRELIFTAVLLTAPVALASALSAVLISGAQTRFLFSGEKLKFKLSNINPLSGFKRMFSAKSVAELPKTIAKIILIATVLWNKFQGLSGHFPKLMNSDLKSGALFILSAVMDAVMSVSVIFIALAAFDYFYQWWVYERDMRMTKQEIRDEYRQQEGDPQVKSQIRQQQKRIAMRRMMQKVPQADVVIRNPTHYAVALAYDPQKHAAPMVLAKGQDELALRIIATAEKSGVPVTENRPLARALYETARLDAEIPEEFYAALADILAWVYSIRKEK